MSLFEKIEKWLFDKPYDIDSLREILEEVVRNCVVTIDYPKEVLQALKKYDLEEVEQKYRFARFLIGTEKYFLFQYKYTRDYYLTGVFPCSIDLKRPVVQERILLIYDAVRNLNTAYKKYQQTQSNDDLKALFSVHEKTAEVVKEHTEKLNEWIESRKRKQKK